jgi:hypothetical protein
MFLSRIGELLEQSPLPNGFFSNHAGIVNGDYEMRYILAVALAIGFTGSAVAATTMPTVEQCKNGYKPEFSKTWTKDEFTKACTDINATVKK